MSRALSLGGLGTIALVATLATIRLSTPPNASTPDGHLVLIIEGDARSLSITQVVAKKDPCGPTDTIESDYHILMLDADASVLARYPLDLSQFDLNPDHIGRPVQVEGCVLIDTKIAMLANVPYLPNATHIQITGPDSKVGELAAGTYKQVVTAAVTARGQR